MNERLDFKIGNNNGKEKSDSSRIQVQFFPPDGSN